MIREYTHHLILKGTDPTATTGVEVTVTGGNIGMDRSWSPAVRAQVTFAYDQMTAAGMALIDPRTAQFARLSVTDETNARTATWDLTVRGYTLDLKTRTVTLSLSSYEALAIDYGVTYDSIDLSNTSTYLTAAQMIVNLLNTSCGSDAIGSLEAYDNVNIPATRESRFVVPGGNLWEYIVDYASEVSGGLVQHYGFTNGTNQLHWALIPQDHWETPDTVTGYVPPAFPVDPDSADDEGSNELIEWTAEMDRESQDWADHLYAEWPRVTTAASTVLITAGTTFNFEYNARGQDGVATTRRKQAFVSRPTWPPNLAGRFDAAAWYLGRRRTLATAQTYTHALDPRLTPWQAFDAAAEIKNRLDSVTHNLTDGTTVVRASIL